MATVERPDVNAPFTYELKNISEDTLLLLMEAMNTQYERVDYNISQHSECNKLAPAGCKVLERDYDRRGACWSELQVLHTQAQDIITFLEGARFVRENREFKSEASFRELQQKARQVADTALRTLEPTGSYPVVTGKAKVEEPSQPSDTYTGRYELSDEQLATAERIRDGLKKEGVIGETTDERPAA